MKTPSEVSRLLEIPDSTLRRLSRQFKEFLSVQRSRRRQYTDRDIETLRYIRERLDRGMTTEQIRAELGNVIDVDQLEAEGEPVEEVTALAPIDRRLARLNDQYTTLAQDLQGLRADRQQDREKLEKLEAWMRLPWWKKLFRRP